MSIIGTRLGIFPNAMPPAVKALTTLAFVNNWIAAGMPHALGELNNTWSLAQEEQFYLVWAPLLILLLSRGSRPGHIAAILLLVTSATGVVIPAHTGFLDHNYGYYNPVVRSAEPLVGCLLAVVWRCRFVKIPRFLAGIGAFAPALLPMLWSRHPSPMTHLFDVETQFPTNIKIMGSAAIAAIFILSVLEWPAGAPARLLGLRPLRYLGKISYGVYLYQQQAMFVIQYWRPALSPYLDPDANTFVFTLLVAVLSVGAASLSWHLVESPFLPSDTVAAAAPAPARRATSAAPSPVPAATIDVAPLTPRYSARRVLTGGRLRTLSVSAGITAALLLARHTIGMGPSPIAVLQALFVAATTIGLLRACYVLVTTLASIHAPVLRPTPTDIAIPDAELPTYSVLVPLYREVAVVPRLIRELDALDYPHDKLQILLIVEEDDHPTRSALDQELLGPQFQVFTFPPARPRSKPMACDLGLEHATGELCTIYDADSRPAPNQLHAMAVAFGNQPADVVGIQAGLLPWNARANWLTAQATAEYAARFGVTMPALDRFGLPVPLGGNSTHFRTAALARIGGWDPHNMTEDADLGIRIARHGKTVRVSTSITGAAADSRLSHWIRRRGRRRKGHLQTWLVHMRNPLSLWRELGTAGFLSFQLEIGYPVCAGLVAPGTILIGLTALLPHDCAWRQQFWTPALAAFAITAYLIRYLTAASQLAYASWKHGFGDLAAAAATAPLYWLLESIATYQGLFGLVNRRRRHCRAITEHSLVAG
jgi:cellulose synthase/poly-beta-1,6-N-acetylglucosamine synthase-like glycosyltransferase/peptidoglycan/LPS O-acetylase OafA/YrhL